MSAQSAELTAQPVTEPMLDVQPPWTVDENAEGKLATESSKELPKELVGAYLHG